MIERPIGADGEIDYKEFAVQLNNTKDTIGDGDPCMKSQIMQKIYKESIPESSRSYKLALIEYHVFHSFEKNGINTKIEKEKGAKEDVADKIKWEDLLEQLT